MGKHKPKAEAEGFWHEFEDSLEHLLAPTAIVVVTLNRVTGEVEVDDAMSTPAETWYALSAAEQHAQARLEEPSVED